MVARGAATHDWQCQRRLYPPSLTQIVGGRPARTMTRWQCRCVTISGGGEYYDVLARRVSPGSQACERTPLDVTSGAASRARTRCLHALPAEVARSQMVLECRRIQRP